MRSEEIRRGVSAGLRPRPSCVLTEKQFISSYPQRGVEGDSLPLRQGHGSEHARGDHQYVYDFVEKVPLVSALDLDDDQ